MSGWPRPGTVYLVGAGPGDPDLITVKGLRCLEAADVVIHDRLVAPELVARARPSAVRVNAGKRPGGPSMPQEEIHRVMVAAARSGAVVVRLHGGDPFVFGRGGEEMVALASTGIPVEVVPGVSSAHAVPACAGIPLTHRGLARSFAVLTARTCQEGSLQAQVAALGRPDTLVALMAVGVLEALEEALLESSWTGGTPIALVERGTTPEQRVVVTRLEGMARVAEAAGIRSPATVVVGDVVALRAAIHTARSPPFREGRPWPVAAEGVAVRAAEPLGTQGRSVIQVAAREGDA
ncbi:uroporphyrinogen-III C-methyltransferase [Limnochorda pilosa]|uniref:uroporphyrinogen-III C-methyltransferase n=1 Tax=Limnochorda pilosa TaxID=1555112 RepID=A0A0K2SPX3_LIMPI|nr:uroporphyrinogen-III C-methyltransferase [Limnochorda pilosa]BAS29168.1 uroporphyrin-III C-methyltransferase [Limnochorda pilosa]